MEVKREGGTPEWIRAHESLTLVHGGKEVPIKMMTMARSPKSNGVIDAEIVVVKMESVAYKMGKNKLSCKILVIVEPKDINARSFHDRLGIALAGTRVDAAAVLYVPNIPGTPAESLYDGMVWPVSIPAATITQKDGDYLQKLYDEAVEKPNEFKMPRMKLITESYVKPEPAIGNNIIAEIKGRESPEKIVLLKAKLNP